MTKKTAPQKSKSTTPAASQPKKVTASSTSSAKQNQKKTTPLKKAPPQTSSKKNSQTAPKNSPVKKNSSSKAPPSKKNPSVSKKNLVPITTTPIILSKNSKNKPSEYPLIIDNPPPAQKIKLGRAYFKALDLINKKIGAILLVTAIYAVISIGLNLLNIYYLHSPVIVSSLTSIILFALSIGLTIYFNDLLKGNKAEIKDLWANWRKVVTGLIVSVVTFFFVFVAFLPFLLLSGILVVFALASLNLFQVVNLLFSFQFQAALDLLIRSSSTSLNWLLAALIIAITGGLVSLFVSLKYFFTSQIIAAERRPNVGSVINYSTYLSRGNKLKLLWMNIFNGFINILGFLFFGIGFLFTLPLTMIASLVVYYDAQGKINELK